MFGIHRKHLDVLAELVNDGIGQFVAEADADMVFLAPIHIKHLCLLARHVLLSVKFLALSGYCQRLADAFHPVHTIIAELFPIVGIEIVVAFVPEKGVGADNELLTVFGIGLFVACGGGIVEVAESDFQVFADGFVDAVGILDHTIVHAPHSVSNMVFSVQALHGVLARKPFQFGGDFPCFFPCDELGGLNTIHQKAKFVRLKRRVQQALALLVNIVFQLQAADIPQSGEVRIEGLFLYWHIVFFQKLFQLSPLHNAVSACVGFEVLFQQQQTDGNVVFSIVCHSVPSCGGIICGQWAMNIPYSLGTISTPSIMFWERIAFISSLGTLIKDVMLESE